MPTLEENRAKMYPFQRQDVDTYLTQIKERGIAVSHAEQGLGKTFQSIYVADMLQARTMLVLCPAIARVSWADELEKWATINRKVLVIKAGRDVRKLAKISGPVVVICTYDLLRNTEVCDTLREFGFDFAVLDEFQQLRNPGAKRTVAAYHVRQGVLAKVRKLMIMSGTPIVSWPLDLWPHLKRFAGDRIKETPDALPMSHTAFRDRYHVTRNMQVPGSRVPIKRIVKARNLDDLRERLEGWAIRRRKMDVVHDLPAMTVRPWRVEGSAKLRSEMVNALAGELPDELVKRIVNAKSDAAMDQIMLEVASSSAHMSKITRLTGMVKAPVVAKELAAELADSTYKIGIFAWNTDVVDVLADSLQDFGPVTITGSASHADRERAVRHFMGNDACRVFIGQIAACGTALTLTAASRVVFVQQSWTPGDNAQAAARFHRIGQRDAVDVRIAYLDGSIDEALSRVLGRKTAAAVEVVED